METLILLLFAAGLAACILTGLPVLWALCWGLCLFVGYALRKGFSWRDVLGMLLGGAKKTFHILGVFVCIGCLTAVWRVCGTIPYIVYHAAGFIVPRYFVLCAFLLCCGMSYITGSSFSTASTVGAICMLLGRATGVTPLPLAGAILAGSFFGDRSSPMSSSAHLVATVTHTSLYHNLRAMFRTAAIPFGITLLAYGLLGSDAAAIDRSALAVFERSFALHWTALLPALLALALCLLRVEVKRTMLLSAAVGFALSLAVEKAAPLEVLRAMVMGYHPVHDAQLNALLAGGGLLSMLNVSLIVCLSSSFSGIFEATGLLGGVSHFITALSRRAGREAAFVLTAIAACMISCNQTLATILTDELCQPIVPDDQQRASWLEDTAIVIAPLIPWSIAGAVPLSILGVDAAALPYACYLYLLPLCLLLRSAARRRKH